MQRRVTQIESIRVLAMAGIFLYHLWTVLPDGGAQNPFGPILGDILSQGYLGVVVFNAITGFVLALPHAHPGGKPPMAYFDFFRRRFGRITPQYYLSLALWSVVALVAGAIFLFFKPHGRQEVQIDLPAPGLTTRSFTDSQGQTHTYSFRLRTGVLISLGVGVLSSFLGIGGGIIHVPAMVYLLNFPVHIATATSIFMLAIMSLSGVTTHIVNGTLEHGWLTILCLAGGVIGGAQLGARLSRRLKGRGILLVLATVLIFVGLRFLFTAFK